MRWELYERLRKRAYKWMRWKGFQRIDGKEPHDFAMDALRAGGVEFRRLKFDLVDSVRRELGRNGKIRSHRDPPRRLVDAHHWSMDPDRNEDWFGAWSYWLSPRQRDIAAMLASGLEKQQVASRIGVTPARISQIVQQIEELVRRGLIVPEAFHAVHLAGAAKVHVREHAQDREEVGQGDARHEVASEEGSEEGASTMSLVPISEQTFVPIHRIERISFFGSHATVKYVDSRDGERIGQEDAVRLKEWIVGSMGPKMAFHRPPGRPRKKKVN